MKWGEMRWIGWLCSDLVSWIDNPRDQSMRRGRIFNFEIDLFYRYENTEIDDLAHISSSFFSLLQQTACRLNIFSFVIKTFTDRSNHLLSSALWTSLLFSIFFRAFSTYYSILTWSFGRFFLIPSAHLQ